MGETDLLPAPDISTAHMPNGKWQREYQAFQQLRPTLPSALRGKYVAVHEGQVVDSGDDQVEVALRCYKKFGYVPIFVGLLSDEPPTPIRVPSPRVHST
jgi:hypothetical protein